MPIPEKYAVLHRYYIWANRMRTQLDAVKANTPRPKKLSDLGPVKIEIIMYRSLWYGLLYVVIEGWKRLQRMDPTLKDDMIDAALGNKKYIALLKDFRNGTFHFHPKYESAKVKPLLKEGVGVDAWARGLGSAFGRWLLDPRIRA